MPLLFVSLALDCPMNGSLIHPSNNINCLIICILSDCSLSLFYINPKELGQILSMDFNESPRLGKYATELGV